MVFTDAVTFLQETMQAIINVWQPLVIALLIVLFFALSRGYLARLIRFLLLRIFPRFREDIKNNYFPPFEMPLRLFFLLLGIFLALIYLPFLTERMETLVIDIFRSVVIVIVGWGFYNLTAVSSHLFENIKERFQLDVDEIVLPFFSKVLRVVIVILVISIIVREWGYDISGLVAGLGLGGLAFALAAQEALSNLFGGLIIITERPFKAGDWIETNHVEGVVVEVSFRSTRVRTFAQGLVTVPNALMAREAIINWSEMGKRRIMFKLGVTYTTPRVKVENCVREIKQMLENHPDIHPDTIFVRFDGFNESSLDILLYFFTYSIRWNEHLAVKEDVNFKIMEILEKEGVSVAFPSRSLYFETPLPQKEDTGLSPDNE